MRQFAAAGHKEPYRPQEVDRACGVPQTATEAGPKSVEVMRVEVWSVSPFIPYLDSSNRRAVSCSGAVCADER